jgi:hypothetical protein
MVNGRSTSLKNTGGPACTAFISQNNNKKKPTKPAVTRTCRLLKWGTAGGAKTRQPRIVLVVLYCTVQGELNKFAIYIITNNIFVITSQPNTEGFGWALKWKKAAGHSPT